MKMKEYVYCKECEKNKGIMMMLLVMENIK